MKTNPLKIGNVLLESNVLAAPLAGVSDIGFRSVCRLSGAALCYTEMISAKGLFYNNDKTIKLLQTTEREKPCAVQIFGSEPDLMAEMCKSPHLRKFDIIDINMGCPVSKIIKNNEGAALMGDIKLAEKVIKACVKAADKPVTVKFRKGTNENNINAVEFAKMCEGSGAALVTVHGRLLSQLYGGKSDPQIIKKVAENVKIPVIANGDIFSADDAENLLYETGAAGVMVARGCLGNPQIFSEISGQKQPLTKKEAVIMHAQIFAKYADEKTVCLNMRKHLMWYLKGVKGAKQYKAASAQVSRLEDILYIADKAFSEYE